jgi:hypothetical protein
MIKRGLEVLVREQSRMVHISAIVKNDKLYLIPTALWEGGAHSNIPPIKEYEMKNDSEIGHAILEMLTEAEAHQNYKDWDNTPSHLDTEAMKFDFKNYDDLVKRSLFVSIDFRENTYTITPYGKAKKIHFREGLPPISAKLDSPSELGQLFTKALLQCAF